jgi:hypothetical protein
MPDAVQRVVPILPVADISRSIDFYNLLGFTARRYEGTGGGAGYAFLTRDALELHLTQDSTLVAGNSLSGVYFYLLSPLAPRPWKMNEFVLSDPDGNLLRFGEPA